MNETSNSREAVLAQVVRLVKTVAADLDFAGDVGETTRLFGDLNWQSVDMVVLAHDIQQQYKRTFPFADFFGRAANRESSGVTVGELAEFVAEQLATPAARAGR